MLMSSMLLESIPDQNGTKHLLEFSIPYFNSAIKDLLRDSRIKKQNIDFSAFDLESFLIKLILTGDDLGLKAVSNTFPFEAIFALPNIRTLVSNKVLQEEQIIAILLRIQDLLAKEFEVKPSAKIESIAWDIYDRCPNFTLVDFIKFTVMCKESSFKTKYQHVTAKGINREYYQEWLKEYEELRQHALTSMKHQFNAQPLFTSKLAQELVPRISNNGKLIIDSKSLETKLIQLKKEFEYQSDNTKDSFKLIDAIALDFFAYDPVYRKYSTEQIRKKAKDRAIKMVRAWQQAYQLNPPSKSEKINELGEKEITADIFIAIETPSGTKELQKMSPPTEKEYYEKHINIFLTKNRKRISSEEPYNILYSALVNEIIEHNYSLSDSLQNWFPKINLNESTLEKAVSKWTCLLLKKFSEEYKHYQTTEIENNTFPYSKKEYLWRRAMKWVCDNCYRNPKNFTSLKLENYV